MGVRPRGDDPRNPQPARARRDPAGARGHTMYHRHSAGSLSYARFAHLGKEGVLGRYPIHYHLVGTTMLVYALLV